MNGERIRPDGYWRLVAATDIESTIEDLPDEGGTVPDHDLWLRGSGLDHLDTLDPADGLLLSVAADGHLTVVGESSLWTFDAEGVEINAGERFDGVVSTGVLGPTVFADGRPAPDGPVQGVADPSILRCGDGSVDIVDRLQLTPEGRLVRTQNVVTDGIYCRRLVHVYEPISADEHAAIDAARRAGAAAASAEAVASLDWTEVDRIQSAIVDDLVAVADGEWERLVCKADMVKGMGLSTMSCSIQSTGAEFERGRLDVSDSCRQLWVDLCQTALDDSGRPCGSAAVIVDPGEPPQVRWDLKFGPSLRETDIVAAQRDERERYYSRHLPHFLEERGLG